MGLVNEKQEDKYAILNSSLATSKSSGKKKKKPSSLKGDRIL